MHDIWRWVLVFCFSVQNAGVLVIDVEGVWHSDLFDICYHVVPLVPIYASTRLILLEEITVIDNTLKH